MVISGWGDFFTLLGNTHAWCFLNLILCVRSGGQMSGRAVNFTGLGIGVSGANTDHLAPAQWPARSFLYLFSPSLFVNHVFGDRWSLSLGLGRTHNGEALIQSCRRMLGWFQHCRLPQTPQDDHGGTFTPIWFLSLQHSYRRCSNSVILLHSDNSEKQSINPLFFKQRCSTHWLLFIRYAAIESLFVWLKE